jgi:hypothetical protein
MSVAIAIENSPSWNPAKQGQHQSNLSVAADFWVANENGLYAALETIRSFQYKLSIATDLTGVHR